MRLSFALTHALRSLLRERRRSVLALACIAFGVLSLVSMQLLSASIRYAMTVPPQLALGGDVRIASPDSSALRMLQEQGVIRARSAVVPTSANLIRREGVARVYFVMRAFGVDAATWPLYGSIEMAGADSPTASEVLATPGHVLVSRDLAAKLGVTRGDAILLSGEPGAPPVRLIIGGVAQRMPDRRGDTMLYGLTTASMIAGGAPLMQMTLARLAQPADTTLLQAKGWHVTTAAAAAAQSASTAELFGTMLKGAGLLGLLIGGVGVANTLQVVLARRTPEIAALKTLGYEQRHLLTLFALETGMLGAAGAALGVATGALVGMQLTRLMSAMEGVMLLEFRLDPGILAGGFAIGVVTALVFGMHAIVRTSAVRPAVLLRSLPVELDRRGRVIIAALYGVLIATVIGINATVLGSPVRGVILTIASALALVVLGGLLLLLLRLVLLAPARGLFALARRSLMRQQLRSAFALTALFAGVFAIAMAAMVFLNGRAQLSARTMDVRGQSLFVYGARADSAAVIATLAQSGTVMRHLDVRATADARSLTLRGTTAPVNLVGGATWAARDGEIVLPERRAAGDSATAVSAISATVGTQTRVLRVAGYYRPAQAAAFGGAPPALVTMREAELLAGDGGAPAWSLAIPADDLEQVSARVSATLPSNTVVSAADYRDFMNRVYRSLFHFVAGVSALALLAGVVLIANAVGLALVERRREMGVLKAMGYGRTHIMSLVMMENAVLGLVGGLAGVAGVYATAAFINRVRPQAGLTLAPQHAGSLVLLAIALAAVTAFIVAFRTTGLRPLAVLREE